jgi:hypothetical protein
VGRRLGRNAVVYQNKSVGHFFRRATRREVGKWWRERVGGRKRREEIAGKNGGTDIQIIHFMVCKLDPRNLNQSSWARPTGLIGFPQPDAVIFWKFSNTQKSYEIKDFFLKK